MKGSFLRDPRSRQVLLWALLAGTTLLLAVSLRDVQLDPGRRFRVDARETPGISGKGPETARLLPVARIIGTLFALGALVSLIVHLASKEGRRKLLTDFLFLAVSVLALSLILRYRPEFEDQRRKQAVEGSGEGSALPAEPLQESVPAFDGKAAPRWSAWALAAGITLTAAAAGAGILVAVLQARRPGTARRIGEAAAAAAGSLRAGEDTRNVVVRCYAAMCRIAESERGVSRDCSMTPAEFVEVLSRAGIPEAAARSLTEVFEEVRYGRADPEGACGKRALEALTEVSEACRRTAP